MLSLNPILRTDSYKTSHFKQYPKGTTHVSSYIEARGGKFEETVFFGLQAFIKEYLLKPITSTDVKFASDLFEAHGVPFNKSGWDRIVSKWGGYLPIEIEAVPEGTVMATGNIQVQVVNSDPELPWLTSYVETALLRAVWYPSTVATLSRRAKQFIYEGLKQTSDDPEGQIPFKLHDFGARGTTSSEAAQLGGMAHLVNFMGTDTIEGVIAVQHYYNTGVQGFSIPATEHSTMTSWGRDNEEDAYRNLLEQHPEGMVACVSDSYDMMNCAENIWGGSLKKMVQDRNGTLIVRPDSGNPTQVPLDVIEVLMDKFGYRMNAKGFKVLPDCIRVIQGDGMDLESIPRLLQNAIDRQISVDNFAMGMGGGLLQKLDRDTLKYAMKASAVKIGQEWNDIFKDPITDQGKRSKKGRLGLIKNDFGLETVRLDNMLSFGNKNKNILRTIYRNGELLVDDSFDEIKERAKI